MRPLLPASGVKVGLTAASFGRVPASLLSHIETSLEEVPPGSIQVARWLPARRTPPRPLGAKGGRSVRLPAVRTPDRCGEKKGSRGSLRDHSVPLPLIRGRRAVAYGR